MSAMYRLRPSGDRSAEWAPWRKPPKLPWESDCEAPSGFEESGLVKERVWMRESMEPSGARVKTSPLGPPAE